MFIMAIYDGSNSYPVSTFKNLGTAVSTVNTVLVVGGTVLMAAGVVKSLYQAWKERKKAKGSDPLPRLQNNRLKGLDTNITDRLDQTTEMSLSTQSMKSRNYHPGPGSRDFQYQQQPMNYLKSGQTLNNHEMSMGTMQNDMDILDLTSSGLGQNQDFSYDQRLERPPSNQYYNHQGYDRKQSNSNSSASVQSDDQMNMSGMNLLSNNNSRMPTDSPPIRRPRIKGKIKMPGANSGPGSRITVNSGIQTPQISYNPGPISGNNLNNVIQTPQISGNIVQASQYNDNSRVMQGQHQSTGPSDFGGFPQKTPERMMGDLQTANLDNMSHDDFVLQRMRGRVGNHPNRGRGSRK